MKPIDTDEIQTDNLDVELKDYGDFVVATFNSEYQSDQDVVYKNMNNAKKAIKRINELSDGDSEW